MGKQSRKPDKQSTPVTTGTMEKFSAENEDDYEAIEDVPEDAAEEIDTRPPPDMSPDTWRKLFRYGSSPTPSSFPSFMTYLYWFRVLMGAFYGTYLGYLGVFSLQMITISVTMLFTFPTTYMDKILKANLTKWSDKESVNSAGLAHGIALYLFFYIVMFTHFHGVSSEEILLNMAGNFTLAQQEIENNLENNLGGESLVGGEVGGVVDVGVGGDDVEF